MTHQSLLVLTTILLAMPLDLMSSPASLQVTSETTFGDSVYVTIPELESFGGGGILGSIKLLPSDYPVWSLPVDLPAGITLTPSFYRRSDSSVGIQSQASAVLVAEPETVTIPGALAPDFAIRVHGPSAESATLRIETPSGEEELSASRDGDWWIVTVPGLYGALGSKAQLLLGSSVIPAANGFRLTGRDLWWRHGQAFHEIPTDLAPSAPREESLSFVPQNFLGRTVRILLPRGYDQNPEKSYPVIYAMDGQNLYSTYTGSRFGSWDLDVSLAAMTRSGEIPEVIVIGVDNTAQRITDYTPEWGTALEGGRGNEFLVMLRDELLPEINHRYQIQQGAENHLFLGSSLGGLLGMEAVHQFQDTWGTVIAMSTSVWVGKDQVLGYARQTPDTRGRLWMDSGTSGNSADGYVDTLEARDAMLGAGAAMGRDFFHMNGLGHQHNEAAWRQRTPAALRWALQTWESASSPLAEGMSVY